MQQAAGRPLGWGPRLLPISERLPARRVFFLIICKAYGGFSFEKQKIPKFCYLKSFFPQYYEGFFFFLQKYKGKENPLKDLVDFSIRFRFILKISQD